MSALDAQDALRMWDALVVPTLVLDAGGHVRWANPAASRLTAWPNELLVGQPVVALVPKRYHNFAGAPFNVYLAEHVRHSPERTFRVPILRRDDVEIEVECIVSLFTDDALILSLHRRADTFADTQSEATATSEPRHPL